MYPDNPMLHEVSDETRLIVSEPLGDLEGAWREVPESTCGVVQPGEDELRPFAPRHALADPGPTARSGSRATRSAHARPGAAGALRRP